MWYILLGIGVGYFLFRQFLVNKADYKQLVAQGAEIIDVREPSEFANGHIPNSKNIPLSKIGAAIPDLQGKTVITVCASGMRSGNAAAQLKRAGIVCYNAGSWASLRAKLA
jgi:phage shock protein E